AGAPARSLPTIRGFAREPAAALAGDDLDRDARLGRDELGDLGHPALRHRDLLAALGLRRSGDVHASGADLGQLPDPGLHLGLVAVVDLAAHEARLHDDLVRPEPAEALDHALERLRIRAGERGPGLLRARIEAQDRLIEEGQRVAEVRRI